MVNNTNNIELTNNYVGKILGLTLKIESNNTYSILDKKLAEIGILGLLEAIQEMDIVIRHKFKRFIELFTSTQYRHLLRQRLLTWR